MFGHMWWAYILLFLAGFFTQKHISIWLKNRHYKFKWRCPDPNCDFLAETNDAQTMYAISNTHVHYENEY